MILDKCICQIKKELISFFYIHYLTIAIANDKSLKMRRIQSKGNNKKCNGVFSINLLTINYNIITSTLDGN